jgi:ATP-dependent helicase Lhr and Lhr-like helicase
MFHHDWQAPVLRSPERPYDDQVTALPPADPALGVFSPVTARWFSNSFAAPTSAQAQGWAAIAQGDHTLILAPTGSGKTLAAFLYALDRLANTPTKRVARVPGARRKPGTAGTAGAKKGNPTADGGVRVLYVSPLKALIYDVERNLRGPLAGITREAASHGGPIPDITVATRTGDTSAEDRRGIATSPPDILVTTPESLYLLLTSQARSILTTVEYVIIDEIHALAGTKRGAHMALSLERLELLIDRAGNPAPQRIGLSATQRPLEEVARFLGGRSVEPVSGEWRPRRVAIVDTGIRKTLELEIIVPVQDMGELGKPMLDANGEAVLSGAAAGDPEQRHSIWPAIYPQLLELIRTHTSTLIFVNSRRLSERLAAKLNELAGEELVRAHHGSIAREQRLEIEEALKAGRLPALVATSSLELGIDMGAIDLVVQVEAPSSVASGLQRIGRAGHQVGEPSKGRIFPKFRNDLISSAVVANRMFAGAVEATTVPRNPIDVLCQQIVALVATEPEGSTVADVATMARGAYPFADLSDDLIDHLLDLLAGRYPSDEFAELRPRITWDRLTGRLTPRPGAKLLAITSGGTIPDRGLYSVTTPEGTKVGELDEEMVFESRVGEAFLLGASTWRIEDITPDKVIVTPAPGVPGKMPFWHGDKLGRPYELGKAIGSFVRTLTTDAVTDEELATSYALDPLATSNLRQYVQEEQEATGGVVPTDRQLVIQRFRDELGDWQLCLLSPFGAQVHAPWAMAIEQRVRERMGMEVRAIWSDDGIMVRLPEADEAPPAEYALIDPDELDELLMNEVGNSALFASRFRENAARALLLPRRKPGSRTPLWKQRQKSADLLKVASRYPSFPLILETYRECLRDAFDVPALHEVLHGIRNRQIRIVSLDMANPSPFASSLAFGYIANFIYDGDAPLAERRAAALALDRDLLAELLGSEELRDLLDGRAILAVEAELQSLDERRHVRNADGVHDLLRRLGDLTTEELAARTEGGLEAAAAFVGTLTTSRRIVEVRIAGEARWIAAEDAARYRDALGVNVPSGLPTALLTWSGGDPADPTDPAGPLGSLLVRWARTHGPFTTDDVVERYRLGPELVVRCLMRRGDSGSLLSGHFRPDHSGLEWVDPDVLRQLRQRSLAVLRKEIEPTTTDALARFLPDWHGVGSAAIGGGVDRLFEIIGQLQGVAMPASVLERDILPARLGRYSGRWLDELLSSGEIVWTGAGSLGRDDGKVSLYLRDHAAALIVEPNTELFDQPEHLRLRELLGARGACFFRELQGVNDAATLDALWDLVWNGEVTNDSFSAVRALTPGRKAAASGAGTTQRRGRPRLGSLTVLGPPKGQGRWSLVARELGIGDFAPVLDTKAAVRASTRQVGTERLHARAVSLLERHGILTREAVKGEGTSGGFAGLYPVLKAMEEAGTVRRGYFVAGLGGSQFAVPGAVDRLRAFRETPTVPEVVVLAATDPANVYGIALPWPVKGPQRAAGAYVVLVDGLPSAYIERGGKSLVALRAYDGTWEQYVVTAIAGLVGPEDNRTARFRKLVFESYPDELKGLLLDKGFVPTPKGLARYA